MDQKVRRRELKKLEKWVDELLVVHGDDRQLTPVEKIDFLERFIELWRISEFKLKNEMKMEEVLDMDWAISGGLLLLRRTDIRESYGTGTAPLQFQRRLIEHLLIDHGRTKTVLGAIDGFIERIHLELSEVDFKRTSTGVMRCYTNTRFAATSLRDAGLLKYTQREAFKMWMLTLPGFVVAARSILDPLPPIHKCQKSGAFNLDRFILDCSHSVETYPQFVDILECLCGPDADIFKTFAPTLKRCHEHLKRYWDVLKSESLKPAEAMRQNREFLRLIDTTEGYGPFIAEFSASIQMEVLIEELDLNARYSRT